MDFITSCLISPQFFGYGMNRCNILCSYTLKSIFSIIFKTILTPNNFYFNGMLFSKLGFQFLFIVIDVYYLHV